MSGPNRSAKTRRRGSRDATGPRTSQRQNTTREDKSPARGSSTQTPAASTRAAGNLRQKTFSPPNTTLGTGLNANSPTPEAQALTSEPEAIGREPEAPSAMVEEPERQEEPDLGAIDQEATTAAVEPETPAALAQDVPDPEVDDAEPEALTGYSDTSPVEHETQIMSPGPTQDAVEEAEPEASVSESRFPDELEDEQPAQTGPLGLDFTTVREQAGRVAGGVWERVRRLSVEQWLWFAVIALGAIFRFWGLGDKPMHHDESMHAYFSLIFAQSPSSYAYDPLLHGPLQFHAEGMMFAILLVLQHIFLPNAFGNPWITDATARIVPALFGLGIVILPYGLRRDLGRAGALIAAFLLAVSPSFVYFSRFLREDIYFNFFMFAMVIAAIRYAHERTMRRFIQLFAASVLAYATFEGFFLAAAIFGAFLAVLFLWDLSHGIASLLPRAFSERERLLLSRAGLLALLGAVASLLAIVGLGTLNSLSNYINQNPKTSLAQVTQLENTTVAVVLYASIVIALIVIGTLVWQMYRDDAADMAARYADAEAGEVDDDFDEEPATLQEQRRLRTVARIDAIVGAPGRALEAMRARIDAERQPFLSVLLNISWVEWFVAFVVGWLIFAALFFIVPGTNCQSVGACFQMGIGKGIWQGLYYWLQQQQIARGGQPFYYYLLLIPLYEQLACVFGLIGLVYSLVRPTRFRLFLVWWFVASFGLYSWAGEKMPWLSIHILLPLMLLAAVALDWVVRAIAPLAGQLAHARLLPSSPPAWATRFSLGFVGYDERRGEPAVQQPTSAGASPGFAATIRRRWRPTVGLAGALGAVLLLIPMIHSMLTLTQVDAANGPLEMMVYVQTTPDVDLVMSKITKADQALYGGRHELRIGVGTGEEWPFYWYLRDYTNVYYGYNPSAADTPEVDVAIMLPYDPSHSDAQTFMAVHPQGFQSKQYKLRSWFDEAYKPEPCIPTTTHKCSAADQWGSGVNLGPYLSYGTYANPHAKFDLGRAASRLWSWLWQRKPLGATGGSYDFVFIVRTSLPIKP